MVPVTIIFYSYSRIITRLFKPTSANSRNIQNRNRKVSNLVATIVFCYVFLWTPYYICQGIINNPWRAPPYFKITNTFFLASALAYFNSALNPWLFLLTPKSEDQPVLFFGLFNCKFNLCRLSSPSPSSSNDDQTVNDVEAAQLGNGV